jgi:probable F420-dependent oxidoreductase
MRIGISCYDLPADDLLALGIAAERSGFDGTWLGEHVLAPVSYESHHPTQPGADSEHGSADHNGKPIVDPSVALVDPLVALAGLATRTSSLRLATGVYLAALRHPLMTARAATTLAALSGGRFRLGVGTGWLREEFAALGVPFAGRTARTEEILTVLRLAWRGGAFEYRGRHYDFDAVQTSPGPVAVPIVLGGNTEPALRRAARLADGWFASGLPSLEEALRLRDRLTELCEEEGRDEPLSITVRATAAAPDVLDAYAREGFEEVLVMHYDVWIGETVEERTEGLAKAAATLGLIGARG